MDNWLRLYWCVFVLVINVPESIKYFNLKNRYHKG